MHSNSILTSNLLDIIFENRNKEYGAYVLRKNYNKRLLKSLLMALALVIMFVLWLTFAKKNVSPSLTMVTFPDHTISSIKSIERVPKPVKHIRSQVKDLNSSPVIVKDDNAKEIAPTNTQILASAFSNIDGNIDGPPLENLNTDENNLPGG